jgi:hypothetical protein
MAPDSTFFCRPSPRESLADAFLDAPRKIVVLRLLALGAVSRTASQEFVDEQDRRDGLHFVNLAGKNPMNNLIKRYRSRAFDFVVNSRMMVPAKFLAQNDVSYGPEKCRNRVESADVGRAGCHVTRFLKKFALRRRDRRFPLVKESARQRPVLAVGSVTVLLHEQQVPRVVDGRYQSKFGFFQRDVLLLGQAAAELIRFSKHRAPAILTNNLGVEQFPLVRHRHLEGFPIEPHPCFVRSKRIPGATSRQRKQRDLAALFALRSACTKMIYRFAVPSGFPQARVAI